jgi:hypothetical protein
MAVIPTPSVFDIWVKPEVDPPKVCALPRKWVSGGAPTLVSSIYAIFCSLSADAFSNQKRPAAAAQQQRVGIGRPLRPLRPFEEPVGSLVAGAFGFQLEQLPERARGPIPRAKLVIQG